MLRDKSLIPLSHQHHNGLALGVLVRRALAEDAGPENVERQARRIVERYEIELTNHFAIEEELLFPACPAELAGPLIEEHRRMEALVEKLRSEPSRETVEEFLELLRGHIWREEDELFERIQRELPRQTLDRLGGEIDARAVRVCL
jgi:hemerythrin-like domain-containing protein